MPKKVLGNMVGGLAEQVGTGFIGEFFNNRAADRNISRMRNLGLTPQEMVGGSAGGGMSASPPVLGNGPALQLAAQAREREKDRALERERIQADLTQTQMQTEATMGAASTSAGASMYGADVQARIAQGRLALEQRRYDDIELPRGLNDIVTSAPDWRRQEILAQIGVDNMIATTIASVRGIDIMDPQALQRMSRADFERLVIEIYGLQSNIFSEGAGIGTLGRYIRHDVTHDFGDLRRRVLGNGSGRQSPRVLGNMSHDPRFSRTLDRDWSAED